MNVKMRNSRCITPHPLAETEIPPYSNYHLNQLSNRKQYQNNTNNNIIVLCYCVLDFVVLRTTPSRSLLT